MATRCFWPPESAFAFFLPMPSMPSSARVSSARFSDLVGAHLAGDQCRHGDVLVDAELRQQVVELEDEADELCAQCGALELRDLGGVGPVVEGRAAGGCVEQAEQVQQRGLAAAGLADDGGELALAELERHVLERVGRGIAFAIDLVEVAGHQERAQIARGRVSHSGSPRSGRASRSAG